MFRLTVNKTLAQGSMSLKKNWNRLEHFGCKIYYKAQHRLVGIFYKLWAYPGWIFVSLSSAQAKTWARSTSNVLCSKNFFTNFAECWSLIKLKKMLILAASVTLCGKKSPNFWGLFCLWAKKGQLAFSSCSRVCGISSIENLLFILFHQSSLGQWL